ncbi:uncharacterized protein LOC129719083 [Wyeomyia smithii]|uniref:uncharacterized protein LOC129719083 n=1 Tax=Wyeomyia smithii TaxID=174621 RepID=UPI0024681A4A|nr:uncharacterized protein LOC129719083 [Wyeomyia smithii]
MPRNDFGKMSAEQRIQPGRVMIVLTDPLIMDDVVVQIAKQYGIVKSLHRPGNNPHLIFLQYENSDFRMDVIEKLRNYPIFRAVDPALRSERFLNDNSNDNNQANQPRSNTGGKSKGNRTNHQNKQKGGGNANANGDNYSNGNHYSGGNDTSFQQMDRECSPQKQVGDIHEFQPEIPLGCWFCTRMPSFECQCGAYYCDTSCQRSDWAKHKAICMPRLVPISYSNKRMLMEATASKQNSSLSGSTQSPTIQDNSSLDNNNKRSVQNASKKNHPNNMGNKNQNKPQLRNGNDDDLDGNGSRQQQSRQETKSSPEDANKVNQLSVKLQRLKLAKSGNKDRILLPGLFPRVGSRVKISASLSAGVIYIYHNNAGNGESSDYHKLGNKIYNATKDAQSLKQAPRVDDVIFAPFMGGFYRAKVLRAKEDELDIQYVDFGNTGVISWKVAKEIADEDLKWAKYLTFPVKLEGIEMFSKDQKQVLDNYEESVEFELVKTTDVRDSEIQEVVLKQPKETRTLNIQLLELKENLLREKKQQEEQKEREQAEKVCSEKQPKDVSPKIPNPSNYTPVLFDESIETKQLPLDCKQRVMIIDASELLDTRIISVIGCEYIQQYATVLQNCLQLGPLDPNSYQPMLEGEVCLVLHEADWSRALYDISEDNFMLLDVGIIANIPTANVRRFPTGLSKTVYNNEVIVENMAVLEKMIGDGKPDSIHGKVVEAWVSNSEDGVCVRIVP